MTDFTAYSWALTLLLAVAAGVLIARILAPALSVCATMFVKRYFKHLVPAKLERGDDIGEYASEARVLALGDGFEFVDVYRPFRGPWMGRHVDVWRAADRKTIALVSEVSDQSSPLNETLLFSVLEDDRHLTTTDNELATDPRGLRGLLARPDATFRELYRTHRARIQTLGLVPVVMGDADPVAAIEDLERQHVQQLVDAGLARYRNDRQTSWSYTLRGGYELYYLARPKIVRVAPGGRRAGQTAE